MLPKPNAELHHVIEDLLVTYILVLGISILRDSRQQISLIIFAVSVLRSLIIELVTGKIGKYPEFNVNHRRQSDFWVSMSVL